LASVGGWVASNGRTTPTTPITWTWYGVEIYGGEGNDTITGGSSVDFLKGEGGSDTISGSDNPASVNVPDLQGFDTVNSPFNAYSDIPRGNAREVIDGGDGNNTLNGEWGNDYIYASGAGANSVYGGWGDDLIRTGDGNDTIRGDWGNDTIYAGNGQNSVYGGDGADTISAGSENDWINGGGDGDRIDGDGGTDTVDYSDSWNAVQVDLMKEAPLTQTGGDAQGDQLSGIENVNGSAYGDTLRGSDVDNVFNGLGGADSIYGREGNDTIHGGAGDDYISGGDGNDWIWGDEGMDSLFGDAGDDNLYTEFSGGMLRDRKLFTGDSSGLGGDTIHLTGTKVGPSNPGPDGVFGTGDDLFTLADMANTLANQSIAMRQFGLFTNRHLADLNFEYDTILFE
jgi:Ca2+-binding RTX toxin-like protein